jgi:hypothetical protein
MSTSNRAAMGPIAASGNGGGGSGGNITFNFIERYGSSTSATSHTFSAVPWANPAAGRRIVVGIIGGSGNAAPSGVTIGGVAATMISSGSRASGGGSHHSSFWIADLAAGTSGDVVITHAAAKARIFCAVWEVFGIASNTPSDTQYTDATNTTTIDVPLNGLLLAIAGYNPSTTWTGRGGDYLSTAAAETNRSITLNNAGATNLTARAAIGPVSTTGDPNHIHAVSFASS